MNNKDFQNSQDNIQTAITRLQDKVNYIDGRLNRIEVNSLPHLEKQLNRIEKRIAYYSGGIVAVIAILELLFRFKQ